MNASILADDAAGLWRPADGYFQARVVLIGTCAFAMLAGAVMGQPLLLGGGAAGICMALRNLEQLVGIDRRARIGELARRLLEGCGPYSADRSRPAGERDHRQAPAPPPPKPPQEAPSDPPTPGVAAVTAPADPIDRRLQSGRYALLLRPEMSSRISREQYVQAIRALDEQMSLVPDGSVLLGMAAERATLAQGAAGLSPEPSADGGIAHVDACYLDRWAVSNAEFQRFVDAGGYEELEYWPEEALPALFDFIDSTGVPGPRYWFDGRFPPRCGRLPVVGVSWYEAVAYARWVGKRMPADAEWTKACAWPIESAPGRIAQRRYPWGESFDARRANLWCSGAGGPIAVDEYPEGATVGGLHQMIGNVWEWTGDSLDESTPSSVRFPAALRSLRGGAFNTYFENQATCHFQSGEHPLARRANIGVRLALDMAGLASPESVPAPAGDRGPAP